MRESPILFSAPIVRAILAGTKTQTRREVTHPVLEHLPEIVDQGDGWWGDHERRFGARCPYGRPGDRLWVRETWQHSNFPLGPHDESCTVFYRADYLEDPHGPDGEKSPEGKYRKWIPSIHMPRSASRILLEITSVRVERLQDISESDACAEGARSADLVTGRECILDPKSGSYRLHFSDLFEQINGAGTWVENPLVWVIEFKRVGGSK